MRFESAGGLCDRYGERLTPPPSAAVESAAVQSGARGEAGPAAPLRGTL